MRGRSQACIQFRSRVKLRHQPTTPESSRNRPVAFIDQSLTAMRCIMQITTVFLTVELKGRYESALYELYRL